jgi:DNA polymerase-3 subunit gamma/tau
MPAEDVQVNYQMDLTGRRDLEWAPDPRTGLEMTLLRMLTFRSAAAEVGTTPRGQASGAQPAPAKIARSPAASRDAAADLGAAEWQSVIASLELRGMAAEMAQNCEWLGVKDHLVQLRLDPRHQNLLTDMVRKRVEEALQKKFGAATRLRVQVGENGVATPAQLQDRARADLRSQAEKSIADDPAVQALQQRLGAKVRPGSVEPME